MRKILIALALLAGCDSYRFDVDESIYKIPNQDKAMLTLERNVEDHYDLKLGNVFEDTTIHFVRGYCPYEETRPAIVLDSGQCVAGIMWHCNEMYVAISNKPIEELRVCGTALLHEFGHCLYQTLNQGNGDARHEDLEFWGIISETNHYACGREW